MRSFHVCQIFPQKAIHVVSGYDDVTATLVWGLRQMGYPTSYAVNYIHPDATNIVFGAHNLHLDVVKSLRPDTIIYNLEQMFGLYGHQGPLQWGNLDAFRAMFDWCCANLAVFDYSRRNVEAVKAHNPDASIQYVPIGYAPILSRIDKPEEQDIDILFIGMPHEFRISVFKELCEAWFSSVFLCGMYGPKRDELIGRSKLVMNISAGTAGSIFSIVRASYFLANQKAVVADLYPDIDLEPDMPLAVRFATPDQLVGACAYLLQNDDKRAEAEAIGFEMFRRRDIRVILTQALANVPDRM